MKNIIIIGTYPNDSYKLDMLNDCINRVKPLGYDIMVVSHYPIPEEIQSKVNYVLYDSENIKVYGELMPKWKYYTDEFSITKNNDDVDCGDGGHILAVTKNINNGINYAGILNYDFFFYMEYDNLFDYEDLLKIEILKNSMYSQNKNMVLFHYINQGSKIYETLMFGGVVSFYVKNIHLPVTENELISDGKNISLEIIFYDKYKDHFHNTFYIINQSSKDYFLKSEINKEYLKFMVEIFGSNKEPYIFLFVINFGKSPMMVKIDDGDFKEYCSGCWYLNKIMTRTKLVVNIISEGNETTKIFDLTDGDILKYLKKGFINFNVA
jgi:hypothetical protein